MVNTTDPHGIRTKMQNLYLILRKHQMEDQSINNQPVSFKNKVMKDKGRLRNFIIRQLNATHGLGLDLDWGQKSSKGITGEICGISVGTVD